MSTSWVELCTWQSRYRLDVFQWNEWIEHLELPLPVYDITRILDPSAAFDMALHAFCCPVEDSLLPVRYTDQMRQMMCHIDLSLSHQQAYMARALYAHCARYVVGVPRIRNPSVSHIDYLPIVPSHNLEALAQATMTPWPATRLTKWLSRVIRQKYIRPLQLQNKYRSSRTSGRRGRKHSCASEHKQLSEKIHHQAEEAFYSIQKLAPAVVPKMRCTVGNITADTVTLALSVQQ